MDEAREVVMEVLEFLPEPNRPQSGDEGHAEGLRELVRPFAQQGLARMMRAWPEMQQLDLDDLLVQKGLDRMIRIWGYDGCARIAREFVRLGEPLPPPLDRFVMGVLDGTITRKQRGPRPKEHRDNVIVVAVEEAMGFGLKPYRNEATDTPSACDLVAECLAAHGHDLSYKAVQKIYAAWNSLHRKCAE